MKKSKMYKHAFILIVLMSMLCLFAVAQQGFRYKAILDTVEKDGFYKIRLSPAIVAACQLHLGDIRIKDNKDSIVPFILQQQRSSSTTSIAAELPLIKPNNPHQVILQNSTPGGIAAVYDLAYFNDSIGSNNKILAIKKIETINVTAPAKAVTDNHSNTWLLWSIIIAVLLLLIYFSFMLLNDINRKTTNTDAPL